MSRCLKDSRGANLGGKDNFEEGVHIGLRDNQERSSPHAEGASSMSYGGKKKMVQKWCQVSGKKSTREFPVREKKKQEGLVIS